MNPTPTSEPFLQISYVSSRSPHDEHHDDDDDDDDVHHDDDDVYGV
jgi:hypothetical protein